MDGWDVGRAATALLEARDERAARELLSDHWSGLDLETAYAVQDAGLALRLTRGETLVGVKLGLTSRARQVQTGVSTPLTGWLTDAMVVPAGVALPGDRLIAPRAEPEIVFLMGERLAGPGVTAATALASVAAVYGGIEILDSRYVGGGTTLADVVADNGSAGACVTGPVAVSPVGLDLSLEGCLVEVDGRVVDSAAGAALAGEPAGVLAHAANELGRRGRALEPGWLVFTGGLTAAVPMEPGAHLAVHFAHLGSIRARLG